MSQIISEYPEHHHRLPLWGMPHSLKTAIAEWVADSCPDTLVMCYNVAEESSSVKAQTAEEWRNMHHTDIIWDIFFEDESDFIYAKLRFT